VCSCISSAPHHSPYALLLLLLASLQVRRRPYSVLLFDEVEKAHAEVFNILLSLLDDGRLTDGKGRTVNFANTVIIMTSNLGSEYLLQAAASRPVSPGDSTAAMSSSQAKELVLAQVKRFFRPEFLNRLDDIVVFDPLSSQQLLGVARLMAHELNERLAPKNITLSCSDAALHYAVSQAYEPAYGARPLRRWLEHHIITDLSRMIVAGQLPDSSNVYCDYDGASGALGYRVEAKPLPAGAAACGGAAAAGVMGQLKRSLEPLGSAGLDEDLDDDDELMET
jgi:ATP-dependent Clp protease ATP-binding subunit ClpB